MKNRDKNMVNKKSKKGIWALLCMLTGILLFIYPKRKKIEKFAVQEKDKLAQIIEKECSDVRKEGEGLMKSFKQKVKDAFIPHAGNNHHPRALSSKALKTYAVLFITLKILVAGFLFFIYPSPAILSQKIASEVFVLTNESRAQAGVNTLAWNDYLAQAAQRKADDMAANGYFAHISPDGKQPWQWINQGEYRYLYMGENLAMDFTTAEIVHSAFTKSPSHLKNILKPNYQDMGIGVAVGEIDGRETTILVEFFGAQTVSPTLAAATVPPVAEPTAAIPTPVVEEAAPDNTQAQAEPESEPIVVSPPVTESVVSPPATESFETEEIVNPDITTETVEAAADTVVTAGEELNPEVPARQLAAEITVPEVFSATNKLSAVNITQSDIDKGLIDYVIIISRYAFLLFIVILMALLMINVLVKPQIQHSAVILQTLALIVLLSTFIFVKFHFLESLPTVLLL